MPLWGLFALVIFLSSALMERSVIQSLATATATVRVAAETVTETTEAVAEPMRGGRRRKT